MLASITLIACCKQHVAVMPRPLSGRPDRQEPEFAGARIVLRVIATVLAVCVLTGIALALRS
jgi:hypothetical protein